jgi:hypothetical protein
MESGVKEKPVIFKGGSVRSILGRKKTQTRRVITRVNSHVFSRLTPDATSKVDKEFWERILWDATENTEEGLRVLFSAGDWRHLKPTWSAGQILWVREAFWASHDMEGREYAEPIDYGTHLGEDYYESGNESDIQYCASPQNPKCPGEPGEFIHQNWEDLESQMEWTPWQHYSKQSPLFMPKWASRLWLKITDVRAEPLNDLSIDDALAEGAEFDVCNHAWADHLGCTDCMNTGMLSDPRWDFQHLWDEINGKRGFPWKANPWVWVFTFEITERPDLWPDRKIDQ